MDSQVSGREADVCGGHTCTGIEGLPALPGPCTQLLLNSITIAVLSRFLPCSC